jgi:hypothetical protein
MHLLHVYEDAELTFCSIWNKELKHIMRRQRLAAKFTKALLMQTAPSPVGAVRASVRALAVDGLQITRLGLLSGRGY